MQKSGLETNAPKSYQKRKTRGPPNAGCGIKSSAQALLGLKSSAPGSEAARDKLLVQKKTFFEKNLAQAAKLPRTSGLFKKNQFLRNSSAPGSEAAGDKWLVQTKKYFLRKKSSRGSAAAPDKWLDREKANNRCSQGRGAPFGGSGGGAPRKSRGVRGGAASRPPNSSQIHS